MFIALSTSFLVIIRGGEKRIILSLAGMVSKPFLDNNSQKI